MANKSKEDFTKAQKASSSNICKKINMIKIHNQMIKNRNVWQIVVLLIIQHPYIKNIKKYKMLRLYQIKTNFLRIQALDVQIN